MDELRTAISDALINACYSYDTSDYIDLLTKREEAKINNHERKLLDVLLSCIGIASAQYVIFKRYGDSSGQFRDEVLWRLRSRLKEACLPDEALTEQLALIENSFEILKREFPNVNEYTAIDLTTLLLEPLSGSFDNLDLQSSRLHLWLFTFIGDAAQLTVSILDNAEKKYNFAL